MKKFFNTTGLCNPKNHYMVDPMRGFFDDVYKLIESHQFFLMHAPRQTGKTTLLHTLAHRLNKEGKYIGLVFSVETAGVPDLSLEMANEYMVNALYTMSSAFLTKKECPPKPSHPISLKDYLNSWSKIQSKPIVLLIDEADSLWDNVMISFLRQMRDGFQMRPENFPASIALVGLRDIREYKMKARGDNPAISSGSPFNVKAESFFLPVFTLIEVKSLFDQHTEVTGQVISKEVLEKIYEFTCGQPWLTNALANEIVSKILKNDHSIEITPRMVEIAKENLIYQRQTHLDSLVDKLKDPRVRPLITALINGTPPTFDDYEDSFRYCIDLGIVKLTSGVLQFANPIYREIVNRVMNLSFQHGMSGDDVYQSAWYALPDGSLDMDKLLRAFVKFYRRHSESWIQRFEYKEAGHQLLLMAFLQRIINGGGRIEREMAVGRGRTDLEIHWNDHVYVIEMKLKHDKYTREDGLEQIVRYLDKVGEPQGYLMLFELKNSEEISWEERLKWEEIEENGKRITVIEL
jgi:AAA domain